MNERPWTGDVFRSTTQTSPSGVVSTRGTRSRRLAGASRSQRSGGGFTCESAEMRRPVMVSGAGNALAVGAAHPDDDVPVRIVHVRALPVPLRERRVRRGRELI